MDELSQTEEVMAALDPKLRKRLVTADKAPSVEYAPTPSVGLNNALNGGMVYGRQILLWGSKSSAKSSLMLETIGMAQKRGKVCAWIDAEMSYDASWAERLGVDSEQLIYSTARTINDMVDVGVGLMDAGVDFIVVDSISSLLPAIYFNKDNEGLKELDQTKQIGAESRDMANAVKMLNYANNRKKQSLLVLISQARNNINAMYTTQQPTGGMATKYYSSTVIKLFSSESEAQAIKGKVPVGDKLIEEKIGRKVRWELQFSKTSPAMQGGEYDFYFVGDDVGVDTVSELVDVAENMGIVKRTGAWYNLYENKYQGKSALVDAIKENKDLHIDIMAAINARN